MKEFLISILMMVTGAFAPAQPVEAPVSQETPAPLGATVLFPQGGGTGIGSATAGDVGKVLTVSDNSPFTYTLETPTGGSGGSGNVSTSSVPNIGELSFWTTSGATPEKLSGVPTTTLTASSPLSLSNTVVKVGGSNSVLTLSTAGAWSGTAGSLAANGGNCSAGSFPLGVDALGAVETCTDAWTEAENTAAGYVANTRTLTVAGTSNQITSSAGAQDLSANRTWTLSFPNQVIFPQYASSTLGFSTPYASSTDLRAGTFTFGGVTASTWPSFCATITGSADLCDGDDATGAGGGITTIGALNQGQTGSTQTLATTTSTTNGLTSAITIISGTNTHTFTPSLSGILTIDGGGTGTSTSRYGGIYFGGSDVFRQASTTGLLDYDPTRQLFTTKYSSSTEYASFKTASTTNLIVNGENFNNLTGTGLDISGNALVTSNIPNASLANSTISGKALGTSLDALTATNGSLTFSGSYDGSTARTVGLNLGNANTWTVNQTFNYSSSTIYSSFATASSTNLFAGFLTISTGGTITIGGDAIDEFVGDGLDLSSGDLIFDCSDVAGTGITCSGEDITASLGTAIDTTEITDDTILEADLDLTDTPSDEDILTSEGTGFEWHSGAELCVAITGSADLCDGGDATGAGGSYPFTSPRFGAAATTSSLIVGTSTESLFSALTAASSTAPQLTLSAGAGVPQWAFRTLGDGALTLSTTTVAGTATSSIPALQVNSTGAPGLSIGSSTPFATLSVNPQAGAFNRQFVVGSSTATNFVVDNGGNVGVGTSTPGSIFSIQGVANFVTSAVSTIYNGLNVLVKLVIPNGTAPTMNQAGSIALDTTSNNLIMATTTTGHVVVQSATTTLYAYTATTSPIVSGTTMNLPAHPLAQVATVVICKVSSGTSLVVNLSNAAGSSDTNAITCTTTETQYALTSNNSFAAYGGIRVEYGTKTGDTGDLSIRIMGYRTSD